MNGTNLVFGSDGYSQTFHDSHGDLQVMSDGTYKFVAQANDVYNDGGTVSFNYTVTDGDGDTSSATAQVKRHVTPMTVNLTASTVTEGPAPSYVFTATLSDASHGVTTIHTDQGDITIADGATTGTLTIAADNGEDVYSDASSLTASITGVSGGGFESLVVGTATATANVDDTVTAATVDLTASTVERDPAPTTCSQPPCRTPHTA